MASRRPVYATGKRKEAVAKLWLIPGGTGKEDINGRGMLDYFGRESLIILIKQPLVAAELEGKFDIKANLLGGGKSGQAGALRLAIARALVKHNPELKPLMRQNGFLTRDAREVERKKYGQPKARKRFQFSKR
ncbi:MAG: 30S ribosomal protein S9 [candidate division Zixibacteria bacterium 4484_93]|nr:MAG: 30S ribosomal protein S9 [candidate division Zixibacteria bacterium 4484_93]